jgi:hypothetical protein
MRFMRGDGSTSPFTWNAMFTCTGLPGRSRAKSSIRFTSAFARKHPSMIRWALRLASDPSVKSSAVNSAKLTMLARMLLKS